MDLDEGQVAGGGGEGQGLAAAAGHMVGGSTDDGPLGILGRLDEHVFGRLVDFMHGRTRGRLRCTSQALAARLDLDETRGERTTPMKIDLGAMIKDLELPHQDFEWLDALMRACVALPTAQQAVAVRGLLASSDECGRSHQLGLINRWGEFAMASEVRHALLRESAVERPYVAAIGAFDVLKRDHGRALETALRSEPKSSQIYLFHARTRY